MKNKIDELYKISENISFCTECPLHETRNYTCPGNIKTSQKNPEFKWMFVGEAPGKTEDETGIVFCGRSGKLLNTALRETGYDDFYITNVIKCRPPDNRDPFKSEVEQCASFLVSQIDVVNPKVIICIGKVAKRAFDDVIFPTETPYEIVTIWHPSYVLRNGGEGSEIYKQWIGSLKFIKEKYDVTT